METATLPSEKQQAGLRLSKDLLTKTRHIAVERGVTLNELVEEALLQWYEKQPERSTFGVAEPSKQTKPGRPLRIEKP